MNQDSQHFVQETGVTADNPEFFEKLYRLIARQRKLKETSVIRSVCANEYLTLSRWLDETQLQESTAVRNILKARRLAYLLINDNGDLDLAALGETKEALQQHLYALGPERQHDAVRDEHMLKVVTLLLENRGLQRQIKQISRPNFNPMIDQLIRDSLKLPPMTLIHDRDTRRAVLSSWLSFLRQSVGSCFGTAPAILIHTEQPELFLKDLNEMLSTGKLKRTFGGIEYSVPMSHTWGGGDLKRRVFLYRLLPEGTVPFWNAPGFVNALTAIGLVEEKSSFKEKGEKIREILLGVLGRWEEPDEVITTNVQEILEKILLARHEITSQDLEDYQNRSRGMIHTSLLMHSPQAVGGKGKNCTLYLSELEMAKRTFKLTAENPLLKTWEFTLASFSETKADFAKWNIYASLGINTNEPGGIGHILFDLLKDKIDRANAEVERMQAEYEQVYAQLKYIESRVRGASEDEAKWLKVEYQSRKNEFNTLEELRDRAHLRAKKISQAYTSINDLMIDLFPSYFQEVYDADMHDIKAGPYDDSPAGFRLLFKHGRLNASQWTMIYHVQEFIEALAEFFVAIEHELRNDERLKGLEQDLSDLITALVNHVRTEEFIESSFVRMARAHGLPIVKDPLHHIEQVEAKPWAYISGGTMKTLISCYWKREDPPTETSRWVDSPTELIVFLIDILKKIGVKEQEKFLKDVNRSMLIHSPTHAFLLKPGFEPLQEAWRQSDYTYTWVRDAWIIPKERFIDNLRLDQEMAGWVIKNLAELLPKEIQPQFNTLFLRPPRGMKSYELRDYILETLKTSGSLRYVDRYFLPTEKLDSTLYAHLPVFHRYQLEERVQDIFQQVMPERLQKIMEIYRELSISKGDQVISAQGLRNLCLALIMLDQGVTSSPVNYPKLIAKAAQKLGYAMPQPILFADTNWVKDYFGFIFSPGTGKLELWRLDRNGTTGSPMPSWKQWLDGSRQDREWGVFNKLQEYSG